MAKIVTTKKYLVAVTVAATEAREERCEGRLAHLTRFLMEAPKDSPLSQVAVDDEHRTDFPALRVNRRRGSRWYYTLYFYVKMDQDTDKLVGEIRELFNKNDWEA